MQCVSNTPTSSLTPATTPTPLDITGFLQCADPYCMTSATHPHDCTGEQCHRSCRQHFVHIGAYVTMTMDDECSHCRFIRRLLSAEEPLPERN